MWSALRCSCFCASSMSRCRISTLLRSFNTAAAACCSRRSRVLHTNGRNLTTHKLQHSYIMLLGRDGDHQSFHKS